MGGSVAIGNGAIMVYSYSWIAGIAAIGFALWRLSGLLEPTQSGIRWQVVVLAALVLGGVVTWTAVSYRMKAGWIALLNLVLFLVAAGRYVAPDTGLWIFPGSDTLSALAAEIRIASGLIRHGIEPVSPIIGLVVVLAVLFWGLGALLVFGLLKERPFVALIPPLVVGLQLLTIERKPSSNVEITLFVLLVALTALAVGVDDHDRGAGRMAAPGHHQRKISGPLSRSAVAMVALTVVAAIGVSAAMASRIPVDGMLTWRAPGSLTAGLYGSVSYNPYVEIHKGLVSQTGRALFTAELNGDVRPGDVYYRLITLDSYDDGRGRWFAGDAELVDADPRHFEAADNAYAGPTVPVTASIEIHHLGDEWLPAPYSVRGITGHDASAFRVRTRDVSIRFSGNRTYNGMSYRVAADVPVMDSAAVATGPDGVLSPLFLLAAATEDGVPDADPGMVHRQLPDADRYLELPDDLDPAIRAKAIELTGKFTTDFEKGLALEYWFRENGGFTYSLDVEAGSEGPDVVADWLFDTESIDYRRGYCEDFATSMGVMARAIGIPTRVVLGFLPGEVTSDGTVLVKGTNSHSWIELWIPSQGWMRFDPTPRSNFGSSTIRSLSNLLNFDIGEYLDQVPELAAADEAPLELLDTLQQPEPRLEGGDLGAEATAGSGPAPILATIFLMFLLIALLILGAIPAVKGARRRSRMRRLANGDITAAWDVIVARLADLDRAVDPAATPLEVADGVGVALQPLASVYTKSVYGPAEEPTTGELDAATRSMTVTEERLKIDLATTERMRATYRLASLVGGRRLSRLPPWSRP